MKKIGVVHGRFQPLHKGHMDNYILLALEKCDFLIIGITNPDPTHSLPDESNLSRTRPQNNPLTYYERLNIITAALYESGMNKEDFLIVPFPINFPQLLKFYVPKDATHYLTVFDEWGENKIKYLKNNGFKARKLTNNKEKNISSTLVREKILVNKPWKSLVYKSTQPYIESYQLKNRLIKITNQFL
ncbi:adenylyltransferase/cytidyltransferase family protein [uncultured Winogradskyella sp.]|uniref:adenylyltransferase/cytidyltransferase family protein n=1 Tax=uncultured Winogradskyella sp. TaxID=395353 RepID=UPI0026156E7B|nr:adenylyltransferase/cytidyltransferase family protein [uncultured Winogradskyella sp.]